MGCELQREFVVIIHARKSQLMETLCLLLSEHQPISDGTETGQRSGQEVSAAFPRGG